MGGIVSEEELAELLEPFGGPDVMRERMRRFEANQEYLEAHREQLRREYPDQWVVIARRQVLGHGDDLDDLLKGLREAGEDLRSAVLHQAHVEEPVWVLAAGSRC